MARERGSGERSQGSGFRVQENHKGNGHIVFIISLYGRMSQQRSALDNCFFLNPEP